MKTSLRFLSSAVLALALAGTAFAADNNAGPLRAALEQSKATGKGVTMHVKGAAIAGVVVSVDEKYVVARSQAQGTIVVRLDRIDAVSGFIGEIKTP